MKKLSHLLKVVVLFFVYFVTAKFGLSIDPVSGFATFVWIPSGIALAGVYVFGYSLFPAIFLGAFLANYTTDAPFISAFVIGIGNTLEAVLGVYFLKRISFRSLLERVRDVVDLMYAAVLASTLAATVGVTSLFVQNVVSSQKFWHTWFAWWSGDALSILILSALIFTWLNKPKRIKLSLRWVETMVLLFLHIVVLLIVFRGFGGFVGTKTPIAYITLPIPLLIALRLGQRETITAIVLLAAITVWGTTSGLGPFSYSDTVRNSAISQGYLAVSGITLMFLAASISEQRELVKRKDHFISMAAHEIKNPITSLNLYTQFLEKQLKSPGSRINGKYFVYINTQTDRLLRIVNDLLDLSRISVKHLELRYDWFNINELAKETVFSMKLHHKKNDIHISGRVKGKIYGDKDRIGQVLTNLLTNAIKYSPVSGKIKIQINKKKNTLVVCVTDSGIGISQEDRDKVFDRFYQVDRKGTEGAAGLGIGLYVSKQIIQLHKGKIWVNSEVGRGSAFFFTLPLKE
jgi:signal transduction histidine kinase